MNEVNERNITINLYIEDPTDINGSDIPAANYLRTVAEGDALFRPNEERGREHIREYISSSDEPWKDTYNDEDFVLREGGEIQVVKESVSSLDFHFDVKKGNLTVKFQWVRVAARHRGACSAREYHRANCHQAGIFCGCE